MLRVVLTEKLIPVVTLSIDNIIVEIHLELMSACDKKW